MGNARAEQMTSQLATGDFPGAAPRHLQPDSVCDPLRTPARSQAAPGKGSPGRQTRKKPRRELAGTMNVRKRSSLSWKTAISTTLFQGTFLQRALMSDHSFCVVLSVTGKSKPAKQDPPRAEGVLDASISFFPRKASWNSPAGPLLPDLGGTGDAPGARARPEGKRGEGRGGRERARAVAQPVPPPSAHRPPCSPAPLPAAPRPPGGATKEGAGRGGGRRGRGARESCRGAQRGGGGRAEQGEVLAQLRAGSRGSEVPMVRKAR